MATVFPGAIQTFVVKQDITQSDAALVAKYQNLMQSGDFTSAQTVLTQIPSASAKIISASEMNTIVDTNTALQRYYLQRFSPAYIVSETQPVLQDTGDFWLEVTD